jgi:hypothetical protein
MRSRMAKSWMPAFAGMTGKGPMARNRRADNPGESRGPSAILNTPPLAPPTPVMPAKAGIHFLPSHGGGAKK